MYKQNVSSITVDDKVKLSGKNGSLLPLNNELPTLDEEPIIDEKNNTESKENINTAKFNSEDGDNGKVIDKDKAEKKEKPESQEEKPPKLAGSGQMWIKNADGELEAEDPDDYLIYLEDILKRIHK